jgi:hypothetical protein
MTVSDTGGGTESSKAAWAAGVYTAVSTWAPGANFDVTVSAKPANTGRGEPSAVSPSMNWTVPAASTGVTCATRITGVLWTTVPLGTTKKVVLVAFAPAGGLTTTGIASDTDPLTAEVSVGMNTAVKEWVPGVKVVVVDAVPNSGQVKQNRRSVVQARGLPRLLP